MRDRIFTLTRLAMYSLLYRRYGVILLLTTLTISCTLLLAIERIRSEVRNNFTNTVAGTDLLVGARSNPLQLLLYTIFHKGQATQNVAWSTYQAVKAHPKIAWTIPLSMGDSHKGYRVIGTDSNFFKHYRFGRKQALTFHAGQEFSGIHDTVVGANVAKALKYQLGDKITLSHGLKEVSFSKHDKHPFIVRGILTVTGTPIDNAVLVSLDALDRLHVHLSPPTSSQSTAGNDQQRAFPTSITAFLLGLKTRAAVFQVQRWLNEYQEEPLQAIIPGVTLMDLWDTLSMVETMLFTISIIVTFTSLTGMAALMLATLNERRREMALLRGLGARVGDIFFLVLSEAAATCMVAIALSLGFLTLVSLLAEDWLASQFSIYLTFRVPSFREILLMGCVLEAGLVASLIPAWRAYRFSLVDGMNPH